MKLVFRFWSPVQCSKNESPEKNLGKRENVMIVYVHNSHLDIIYFVLFVLVYTLTHQRVRRYSSSA